MPHKVNLTIEVEDNNEQLILELLLKKHNVQVKSFKVMPDTDDLYENNENFRKLAKLKKKADEEYRNFLNDLKQ